MSDFSVLFPDSALSKAGGNKITVENGSTTINAVDYPLVALNLYGKSVQDGTPSPEAPAEIVSVGDDGAVEVTACGKNLYENIIPVGYQSTINGITFTVNKDRTITANGTSTDSVIFPLKCTEVMDRFVGKDVILNGCPKGGGTWDTYYMQTYLSDYTGGIYDRGDGVLITNWEADRTIIRISIGANVTVNNLIFKPMICLADITDDTYEPYMGNTATITTGLPLCSVGDVRDELVYNADGTGKIVKRTASMIYDGSDDEEWWYISIEPNFTNDMRIQISLNNSESSKTGISSAKIYANHFTAATTIWSNDVCGCYSSWNGTFIVRLPSATVGGTDITAWRAWLAANPLTLIYPLGTEEEIELSADEMVALAELQTFEGVTNIFNDEGAETLVKVATNPMFSEYVKPVIDGITARFEARIAALESAVTNT